MEVRASTPVNSMRVEGGSNLVLFHIGLPKAASSYLQECVFPAIDNAEFLSISSANSGKTAACRLSSANFVADPEAAKAEIRSASRTKVIVSAEGFVGNPYDSFSNHMLFAEGLKTICPQASILLILRRQDKFCASLYVQALRKGYPYGIRRFLCLDEPGSMRYRSDLFNFRALDLNKIVGTYESLFGKKKLWVLPMEALSEDKETFVAEIMRRGGFEMAGKFPGRTVNPSYSNIGFAAARVFNKFCWGKTEPILGSLARLDSGSRTSRKVASAFRMLILLQNKALRGCVERINRFGTTPPAPLNESQSAFILDHFKTTNQRLSERFNLKLERYGYF